MRGSLRAAIVVALLGVGAWQLGAAAWIHVKARIAQHLLQRAWTRTLRGEDQATPWPWADTWPVARLRAPAHGVDLIVLADVSGRTLAFGPGHVAVTTVPGMSGTAVLTGHRDTHFRFLERVRIGDELIVETAGRPEARFRVRETAVVDARITTVRGTNGTARLVLLTCYPFDAVRAGGPLRYAVVAE
jgi:sortase A